jgi:hypothetical protein
LRADHRGGGDGARAARRHELGAGARCILMKVAALKDDLRGAAFQQSSCPGLTRASIPSRAVESTTVTGWNADSSPAMTTLNVGTSLADRTGISKPATRGWLLLIGSAPLSHSSIRLFGLVQYRGCFRKTEQRPNVIELLSH